MRREKIARVDSASLEIYGRLTEGLHVAGYSFERAASNLERLLEGNAWELGGRFKDVNEFLDSLRLGAQRHTLEQRKRIVLRIKELQPKATNRAIARTLGVGKGTVDRDVGGPNGPGETKKIKQDNGQLRQGGPSGPSEAFSGEQAAKTVARAERVKDQQQSVSARTAKVSLDARKLGKSSVILADPPWDDDFGANRRSTENHYPTMSIEEILAMPVSAIAHDRAMLFLWTTSPMLVMGLETAKTWGFEYRTQIVWVKPSIGLGKYVRQRHEILLICRRGDHPAPDATRLPDSVIEAPRAEHSAKPAIFHEIIERMYPEAERVELFRRGKPRKGWKIWGAEAQMKEAAAEHSKLNAPAPYTDWPELPACLKRAPP